MTSDRALYDKVKTDYLMFSLEPGRASRTKFAIEISRTINDIDVEMLDPDEVQEVKSIKEEVQAFLF